MASIHDACIRGDIEEVQRLLDSSDNPNALLASNNETGFNAYALAFINKKYELIRHISRDRPGLQTFTLLQDILKLQKLDCSIHDAIDNGFIDDFHEELICDTIVSLLNEGKDINSRNSSLDTPLHIACRYKMKSVIDILLKKGADVHSLNRVLRNPLHELCDITGAEDPEIFEDILISLINHGAVLDAVDSQQQTPLDVLYENDGCVNLKKAFTNSMVKQVVNLKQSLDTVKKENNLTPQVQYLLIQTSIAIKQLEQLSQFEC